MQNSHSYFTFGSFSGRTVSMVSGQRRQLTDTDLQRETAVSYLWYWPTQTATLQRTFNLIPRFGSLISFADHSWQTTVVCEQRNTKRQKHRLAYWRHICKASVSFSTTLLTCIFNFIHRGVNNFTRSTHREFQPPSLTPNTRHSWRNPERLQFTDRLPSSTPGKHRQMGNIWLEPVSRHRNLLLQLCHLVCLGWFF